MTFVRPNVVVALAVAALAAATLSGCGRFGPLELPPSNTASAPPASPSVAPSAALAPGAPPSPESAAAAQQAAAKNGFDSQGNPVAPPGEKKDFFLDFLLK